jgi:hypothetical protein
MDPATFYFLSSLFVYIIVKDIGDNFRLNEINRELSNINKKINRLI